MPRSPEIQVFSRHGTAPRSVRSRAAFMRRAHVLFACGLATCVALAAAGSPGRASATEDTALLDRVERVAKGDAAKVADAREQRRPFHFAIELAALRNGLAPSLLWALVRVESNFDPEAVSPVGAQGLGQLMPATAAELGVRDPFDPRQNLDAAAAYLSRLVQRFKSVRLALAAYNAGPARARSMLENPQSQTYGYVEKVLAFEREFRARESL